MQSTMYKLLTDKKNKESLETDIFISQLLKVEVWMSERS